MLSTRYQFHGRNVYSINALPIGDFLAMETIVSLSVGKHSCHTGRVDRGCGGEENG